MTSLPPKLVRNKSANIMLTDRDRQIIEAVHRFRFLTTDQIQQLTGNPGRRAINRRLKELYDCKYLDRPTLQHTLYSHSVERPLIHALGNEGARFLEKQLSLDLPASVYWTDKNKKVKRPEFIFHSLGIADFFISLEEAMAKHKLVHLVGQQSVLNKAPGATRRLTHPLSLPTEYRWTNGDQVNRSTVPDGIFAIVDKRGEEEREGFLFLEYDGNTMPIIRNTPNQSSIVQKMLGYADVYDRRLLVARFGYTNFRVLFVTRGRERIKGMVDAYNKYVSHAPAGMFMFADYDELIAQSPLGSIWMNGKGEPVQLLPNIA